MQPLQFNPPMKLLHLALVVPALLLASCASPNNSPMQQGMARGMEAAAAAGAFGPASAPGAGFRRQPTPMEKFFE